MRVFRKLVVGIAGDMLGSTAAYADDTAHERDIRGFYLGMPMKEDFALRQKVCRTDKEVQSDPLPLYDPRREEQQHREWRTSTSGWTCLFDDCNLISYQTTMWNMLILLHDFHNGNKYVVPGNYHMVGYHLYGP